MKIDWAALGIVAVVATVSTVVFVILLAAGIRMISASRIKTSRGGSGAATLSLGYTLIGLAGLLVLFGIYLIVPQFH